MQHTPTPGTPAQSIKKRRYHYGKLRDAAILRGKEIVAAGGPAALGLRGLARDLGVTAPALVYHFGTCAGLRSAVAAAVLEQAESEATAAVRKAAETSAGADNVVPAAVVPAAVVPAAKVFAAEWVAFAARNANLYRLAAGEGWRSGERTQGIDAGPLAVSTPWHVLDVALRLRTRSVGQPRGDEVRSLPLAAAVHGLALARVDGVAEALVGLALAELSWTPSAPARPASARPSYATYTRSKAKSSTSTPGE